jgi:hypothetical protein
MLGLIISVEGAETLSLERIQTFLEAREIHFRDRQRRRCMSG